MDKHAGLALLLRTQMPWKHSSIVQSDSGKAWFDCETKAGLFRITVEPLLPPADVRLGEHFD